MDRTDRRGPAAPERMKPRRLARPQVVRVAAPGKVNLYLHIIGRRSDGYHLLDTLVAFTGLHDVLILRAADELSLVRSGPHAALLEGEADDLVLRAARALATAAEVPEGVAIELEKRVPVAAGLGGGSADAAAALAGLCRLWGVDRGTLDLPAIALELGADVPACLRGLAAFLGGIGEQVTPAVALPPAYLVLVQPPVPVPTAAVFNAYARGAGAYAPRQRAWFETVPRDTFELAEMLGARRNDLTDAAIAEAPMIAEVLAALAEQPDCLLARMTGSGATCFGLFASAPEAAAAAARLARARADWWVCETPLMRDAAEVDRDGEGATIHFERPDVLM